MGWVLRKQWNLKNIFRKEFQNFESKSEHFEESKYKNTSKKMRLMSNAIPTIKKNSIPNTIISLSDPSLNSDSFESNPNVIDIESQKDYLKKGILL